MLSNFEKGKKENKMTDYGWSHILINKHAIHVVQLVLYWCTNEYKNTIDSICYQFWDSLNFPNKEKFQVVLFMLYKIVSMCLNTWKWVLHYKYHFSKKRKLNVNRKKKVSQKCENIGQPKGWPEKSNNLKSLEFFG